MCNIGRILKGWLVECNWLHMELSTHMHACTHTEIDDPILQSCVQPRGPPSCITMKHMSTHQLLRQGQYTSLLGEWMYKQKPLGCREVMGLECKTRHITYCFPPLIWLQTGKNLGRASVAQWQICLRSGKPRKLNGSTMKQLHVTVAFWWAKLCHYIIQQAAIQEQKTHQCTGSDL